MTMDKDEMHKYGITGCRQKTAFFLLSKVYDIVMICLIMLYSIMIVFYFALEDFVFEE